MMLLLLVAGCTCGRDVRHAKPVAVVDNIPQDGQKGHVEFVSTHHNAPFPIFLIDDPARPVLLGAIGLHHGDKYSYSRHGTEMGEKLRVALPPGDHTFAIEQAGEALKVPVVDGQVTPVEIDYVLLDGGDTFAVYQVGNRVFSPTAKQTAMVRSATSK
jgi:hypothetical protein